MSEVLTEEPDLVGLAQVVGSLGLHVEVGGTELLDDLRILESIPMPGDPPENPGIVAGFQSAP